MYDASKIHKWRWEMSSSKNGTGLTPNVAGLLCYVAGWISGIVFLIIEKDSKFVKFHALQSIVTFGILTVVQIILSVIPFIGWVLVPIIWILMLILWIILMIRAYSGKMWKLPLVGNWAEEQANKG